MRRRISVSNGIAAEGGRQEGRPPPGVVPPPGPTAPEPTPPPPPALLLMPLPPPPPPVVITSLEEEKGLPVAAPPKLSRGVWSLEESVERGGGVGGLTAECDNRCLHPAEHHSVIRTR